MLESRVVRLLPLGDVITKRQRSPVRAPVSEAKEEIITIIRPCLAEDFYSKPGTCVLDTRHGPNFPTTPGPGVELDAKLFHKDLNVENGCTVYFKFDSVLV